MGERFTLVTTDGEVLDTCTFSETIWQSGDVLHTKGMSYRVVSTIPIERVSEFVDEPIGGVLEVEPI